jgi:hypothetical protein
MKTITAMQIATYVHPEYGDGSSVQCPRCTDLAGQDVELPAGSVVKFEWAAKGGGWDVCDSCGAVLGDEVEYTILWREPALGETWEWVIQ